jgi:exopolysaccharide biosynthesis polyprenyl glycosylphosphotransferase
MDSGVEVLDGGSFGASEIEIGRHEIGELRALGVDAGREAGEPRRAWILRRSLLSADVLTFGLAFVLVTQVFMPVDVGALHVVLLVAVAAPMFVVIAKMYGLYDRDEDQPQHSTVDELDAILHMVLTGTFLAATGAWLTGIAAPDFSRYAVFCLTALVISVVARASTRALVRRWHPASQRTIIVGAGDVGHLVARKLLQRRQYGLDLLGFVDSSPKSLSERVDVLGSLEDLPEIVAERDVDRVIFAFSNDRADELVPVVRALKELGLRVDIVPRLYEVISPGLAIHSVEGVPLVSLPPFRLSRSSRLLKRGMDIVLSALGLILLAPLMAVIAVWIKLDSPGPVFFRQLRMGADGKKFLIVKFRTMTSDADARKEDVAHLNVHANGNGGPQMFKILNDPRVTDCGWVLRRHSLDELPQLLNVLIGQMTLVGPRPLILEEDQHVPQWGRARLDLKPGITGLWQVLGSSLIPFSEMVQLDYIYMSNWSLWTDLRLLLKSVRVFAGRELA